MEKGEKSFNIDFDQETSQCSDRSSMEEHSSMKSILQQAKLLDTGDLLEMADEIFNELSTRKCVPVPGSDFVSLSLLAMETLKANEKTNVVYKLAKIIACKRPDSSESLIPLDRMPWGLLQYQIDFFACKHIKEVNFKMVFLTCSFHVVPTHF